MLLSTDLKPALHGRADVEPRSLYADRCFLLHTERYVNRRFFFTPNVRRGVNVADVMEPGEPVLDRNRDCVKGPAVFRLLLAEQAHDWR